MIKNQNEYELKEGIIQGKYIFMTDIMCFVVEFFVHEKKMTLRPHVGNCRNFAGKKSWEVQQEGNVKKV